MGACSGDRDRSGASRRFVPSAPQRAGRGKIFAKSLERSTVDLAMEFVNLIQNQRGFQANAKTITTTDELLGEVINLKR